MSRGRGRPLGRGVRVGVGQHAVTQVEDVARGGRRRPRTSRTRRSVTPTARTPSAGSRLPCSATPGPTRGRLVERHPPVDADDVGARLAIKPSSSPVSTPKWIRGTPWTALEHPPAVRQDVRLVVGPTAPAHESNSWTARGARGRPAPAGMSRRDRRAGRASACQGAGSPYISALVRSWLFDGPPSTRYDASVNGPPAKPISGVAPSSATSAGRVGDGATCQARAAAARRRPVPPDRLGDTGPTPGTMSRSSPPP